MPLDHAGHQKLAAPIDYFRCSVASNLAWCAGYFRNAVAFDEDLAGIGGVIDCVPNGNIGEQKSCHGFPLLMDPAGVLFTTIAFTQPPIAMSGR